MDNIVSHDSLNLCHLFGIRGISSFIFFFFFKQKTAYEIPSDGEFGKAISWSQYALERLSGFERRPVPPGGNPFARGADRARFAEFYAELDRADGPPATAGASGALAVCVGPIEYTGQEELQRDIRNFKAA